MERCYQREFPLFPKAFSICLADIGSLQFKKKIAIKYGLRRVPKKRGVSSVDDLYYILFFLWVFDDSTFPDEQQQNQVSAGILMASYLGVRPISIFDTRLKFEEEEEEEKAISSNKDESEPEL